MGSSFVLVGILWMFTADIYESLVASAQDLSQFTKLCFDKDNICYFYSNNTVVFSSLDKLQLQCPDESWLITVFNKTIQGHLKTIISKLKANNQYAKIVVSLKEVEKHLFWVLSNESKVQITYDNWNIGEMAADECTFVSEEHANRWQTGPCSGLTRVVCMSRLCRWTWEKVEGQELNFERGTRITTITNLRDCKTYCELEKSCIGVYISYWNHCWIFQKVVGHTGGENQVLYLKSQKSVCSSTHGSSPDRNLWHHHDAVQRKEQKFKRQSEEAGGWEKEPDPEAEEKSILEPLHTLMKLLTFGAMFAILLIRIATWIFSKMGKKKEKIVDEPAN